ncbi:non-specific lipid transfer protein GPI-anchored 20 [Manihot esculenta]|uniref:Bifunctional inhibitor/plant lipid transfer protein/seed storage helical domain-containing protein n=1 Tax=Manihot esculenta TaxID=3983 RepID=A0A2C9UCN5_MANES|nr:non-specific lipid transfer protein GPI-anchored 20 [Manihot esculenta]OAY27968.1 hypothetical protein MANES_15G030600v8 [Manihot esculenta]
MALLVSFSRMAPFLAIALIGLIYPAHGQINTPCTPSSLSSISPCMNFLTNSSGNGTSPSQNCCNSLKNLTSNGMGCLCLIVTGSVPFQIPINRSLAISLPRACNMPGVQVQCKASVSPTPAPGPASPRVSPSASPQASVVPEPTPSTLPPESSTTPSVPTVDTGAPTSSTGNRPVVNPPSSAAVSSYSFSPSLLLFAIGFVFVKYD